MLIFTREAIFLRVTKFSCIERKSKSQLPTILSRSLQRVVLGSLAGLLAGLSGIVFILLPNWLNELREVHPLLIWGLPLGGLLSGLLYSWIGKEASRGNVLVMEAIHDLNKKIPIRMAPLILVGTCLTHLFGGSAGREGAAVQMSASLSGQLGRWFCLTELENRSLLVAAVGAGFGSAVGAPWAGFVFGLELLRLERFCLKALLECGIASWVGVSVTRLLNAPHPHFPPIKMPPFHLQTLLSVVLAGLCFGVFSRIFVWVTHRVQIHLKSVPIFPPFIPAAAGLVLAVLYSLEGSFRYAGLGLSTIQSAFHSQVSFLAPIYKLGFTALTVGAGFKGGEYVPLVFMGSTLGSALSSWLLLPSSFLASLGYVALFGGAAQTPIACTVLAMELFGGSMGPYTLVVCGMSFWIGERQGIYHQSERFRSRGDNSRKTASAMWPLSWRKWSSFFSLNK